MSKPLITIIFPTFKRPKEVEFNLKFFRENITILYEVFILDNSPESSSFSLNENENYIFLNENFGTSSRNIGIKKANSPICLLLDDDSHPMKGVVERITDEFQNLPDNCAGLISEIHNPDGGREASLLPTVFHGAGVAFKTEALIKNSIFYPEDFCFYGEEYRMTLEIYKAGMYLQKSSDFKVMHRRSQKGRDKSKIFYYLGRNNRAIWDDIVPEEYKEQCISDSQKRYELTSAKEKVEDSFQEGLNDSLKQKDSKRMTGKQFESFALIDKIEDLPEVDSYTICGTGKFPTIWADLISKKCKNFYITDFNPGLIGHSFGPYKVISPEEALLNESTFINGLSSDIDLEKWHSLLNKNNRKELDLSSRYEPNFC